MPNRTIYIRDADRALWEKAEQLAGNSLSRLLADAVRTYVKLEEQREATRADRAERIVVDTHDAQGRLMRKAFVGRWLVRNARKDMAETAWSEYCRYSVALTRGGRFAVLVTTTPLDPKADEMSDLKVYDSWAEMNEHTPQGVVATVAAELGEEYVIELDI